MNLKEFKDKMENPQFKAAVYLCGYLLLGIILVALARDRSNDYQPITPDISEDKVLNEEKTIKQLLSNFDNYAYEITLNHTVDEVRTIYDIKGIRYKEEEIFTYPVEEDAYYVKNNQYYTIYEQVIEPVETSLFPIDLIKLTPENLASMLGDITPTLENTIDGVKTSTYYIPFENFISYYEETALPILNSTYLKFQISTKEEIIEKIEFDLTNFVNQKEFTIEELTYICKFSYQNQIEEFKTDFIIKNN